MAGQYGFPFHLTRFDTKAEAARRGESAQVTARQLRYDWFQVLRRQHGYAAIATAHHLDDVLETLLLNLTRGTGLAGLTGIPIRTQQGVVRPLWAATREQIGQYAHARKLTWREDATNATDAYARNRLRHQVVPVLKDLNPGLLTHLPQTLTYLRAAQEIVAESVATAWNEVTKTDPRGTRIDIQAVRALSQPLFRLGEWLRPYGFSAPALDQFWQSVDQTDPLSVRNGQTIRSATHRLTHDRGTLWLQPLAGAPPEPVVVTDWPGEPIRIGDAGYVSVERFDRQDWDELIDRRATTALLDADQVPLPWMFRRWRPGDRFWPLGLNGTQLVSDLLTNAKVPAPQRADVWVLEAAGQIAWVVGQRLAHSVRVTPATGRLIRLHVG